MSASTFVRTKNIPTDSDNEYYYRIHRKYENGGQREKSEYIGPVDKYSYDEENDKFIELEREAETKDEMNEEAVQALTRQGAMVERDAAEILTMKDVEMIKDLETTPMFVSEDMIYRLREKENYGRTKKVSDPEMTEIMIKKEVPEFKGVDGEDYPATIEGDIIEVPEDNAEILVTRGNAEYLEEPEPEDSEGLGTENEESQNNSVEYDQRDEETGLKMLILSEMPERGESIHKDELSERVDDPGFSKGLERLKREGAVFESKQHHVQRI